jgi:para-aminobenzoate synthetase component 1
MTKPEFIEALNRMGSAGIPFLFMVDFEFEKPLAIPLTDINSQEILYSMPGFSNAANRSTTKSIAITKRKPIPYQLYEQKFNIVFDHLCYGDSYLTNLTVKTGIELSAELVDVFYAAQAQYKLLFQNQFLVFSPECFVRIKGNRIHTYPMKGTIDASIPNAATTILRNPKELAEHVTIVDLLRNDLSQVATDIEVTRFRYVEEIVTNQKNLLQVSSEIRGTLPRDFRFRLGDIFSALLPAGSVTGAPKPKTLEIITSVEAEPRGYYTGVFGVFDGTDLDSAVMIRYIENQNDRFFYRSGGGITTQSSAAMEYQEVMDKVYIPIG